MTHWQFLPGPACNPMQKLHNLNETTESVALFLAQGHTSIVKVCSETLFLCDFSASE